MLPSCTQLSELNRKIEKSLSILLQLGWGGSVSLSEDILPEDVEPGLAAARVQAHGLCRGARLRVGA